MRLVSVLAIVASAAVSSHAQSAAPLSSYTEPTSGVTYKIAIPETEKAPFPILMSIVAPNAITWAGWAAGACMLRGPLIVAWPKPNNAGIVVVSRWAKEYHAPDLYPNTTITTYPTSSSNATHWTANFLCSKGCSDWYGGEIDAQGTNSTFGFGMASTPVAQPNNVNSALRFHNVGMGHYATDVTAWQRADFQDLVTRAGTTGL